MKITKIETAIIRVPLARPFKTALRTVEHIEDVLVRVTTDTGAHLHPACEGGGQPHHLPIGQANHLIAHGLGELHFK